MHLSIYLVLVAYLVPAVPAIGNNKFNYIDEDTTLYLIVILEIDFNNTTVSGLLMKRLSYVTSQLAAIL